MHSGQCRFCETTVAPPLRALSLLGVCSRGQAQGVTGQCACVVGSRSNGSLSSFFGRRRALFATWRVAAEELGDLYSAAYACEACRERRVTRILWAALMSRSGIAWESLTAFACRSGFAET